MAVETVLMYNCNGEQWAKLRQIFLMLRVRIRPVEADQIGRASCREKCRSRWSPYH